MADFEKAIITDRHSAEAYRADAQWWEDQAARADLDGDKWDAADCVAKAREARRRARRMEGGQTP